MPKSSHYHGYKARHPHPSAIARLQHRFNGRIDTATLDRWIVGKINVSPDRFPSEKNSQRAECEAVAVFSRTLALYGEILTISGIPCSSYGSVLSARASGGVPGVVDVVVCLPILDNVPADIFGNLFRDALAFVLENFSLDPDQVDAEEILGELQRSIIEPFSKAVPFKFADQSILDFAHRQNVPYRHLGLGFVRLGWGVRSQILCSTVTEADGWLGREICGNKQMGTRVLSSGGFPVPENVLVPSAQGAIDAAQRLGWPVVVKPPHRERSEGVTTNIDNEADLVAAYKVASRYDAHVLVERHAPGDCHRILVANGKVIYAVKRAAKSVTGDGVRSVTELVASANATRSVLPPWRRTKPWPLDKLTDACLARQGAARDTVLAEGRRIRLRDIESNEWGGEPENLTAVIHPDNAQLALDVARYIGLSVSGVDLMTTDISVPWHENGAVLNELNFQPEFRWWDREGDASTVIAAIVEGDGRIPVHFVTGKGNLLQRARTLGQEMAASGISCHITTPDHTEDGNGLKIHMAQDTLFDRAIALLMRPTVEALILAGPETEFLRSGFPADRLESIVVVDRDAERAGRILRAVRQHVEVRKFRRLKL